MRSKGVCVPRVYWFQGFTVHIYQVTMFLLVDMVTTCWCPTATFKQAKAAFVRQKVIDQLVHEELAINQNTKVKGAQLRATNKRNTLVEQGALRRAELGAKIDEARQIKQDAKIN